jgi:hypothetical protein
MNIDRAQIVLSCKHVIFDRTVSKSLQNLRFFIFLLDISRSSVAASLDRAVVVVIVKVSIFNVLLY